MSQDDMCMVCGNKDVETTRELHHFLLSGLPNVYVENMEISRCRSCGDETISIPASLMDALDEAVLLKPGLLTGAEIKYLRKDLILSVADFASLLGVDEVQVSRWEAEDDKITPAMDLLIRLVCATSRENSFALASLVLSNAKRREAQIEQDYCIPLELSA